MARRAVGHANDKGHVGFRESASYVSHHRGAEEWDALATNQRGPSSRCVHGAERDAVLPLTGAISFSRPGVVPRTVSGLGDISLVLKTVLFHYESPAERSFDVQGKNPVAFVHEGDFAASAVLLVLVTLWASYRIMWGQGLRSQFSARILLPRLFMGAVLINFALPMIQAVVAASNTLCRSC